MINFLRSLFGFGESADNRTIVGNNNKVDVKDVAYIRNSNTRLTLLYNLSNRYKNTPPAAKIQAVYEKTKAIHTYLVARKRVHELELFHVQHTDHFINTFTVIMDVYQSHHKGVNPPVPPTPMADILPEKVITEKVSRPAPIDNRRPLPPQTSNSQPLGYGATAGNKIGRLAVPDIWINPAARILYEKQQTSNGPVTKEISFISTRQEQENFLLFVSARLGIRDISYVGNAMVQIPGYGTVPTGIVPVLYWNGFTYALNLKDNCLFPVRVNR